MSDDLIRRRAVLALFVKNNESPFSKTWQQVNELPSVKLEPCDDCISRQAAIDALTGWETEPLDEDIEWTLNNLPSVKTEVVRCKDCRHRDPEDKKCDCGMWHVPFVTKDDDFCSYGERKDNG